MGLLHLLRSTLKNHISSFTSGSRTDVDYIIGLVHDILVMLHDDNGVAIVA